MVISFDWGQLWYQYVVRAAPSTASPAIYGTMAFFPSSSL